MPNGVLDYGSFVFGTKNAIDVGKVNRLKTMYSSDFYKNCYPMLVQVNNMKLETKNKVKKEFDQYKKQLENLGL
jgi:hypothetical protein